jgi:hypothetical protein
VLSKGALVAALAGTRVNLAFGDEVLLSNSNLTADESERAQESETHRRLRESLVHFCIRVGIGIYPNNVGRVGRFVMADAILCVEGRRPLFVEILASCTAITPENIERKRMLHADDAPLVFLMTGQDYDCYVGWGDEAGWCAPFFALPRKDDIFHTGIRESRLTTRGTLRKRRRWIPAPTFGPFALGHFGLPVPPAPARPR